MISETHNTDCVKFLASLKSKSIDLGIVDPPYGIGADKPSKKPCQVLQKNGSILRVKNNEYTHKDWDNYAPGGDYFAQLDRVCKNVIVWGGNYSGLQGGYICWDKLNGESDQLGCELAYCILNNRTDMVYYMWSGMFQGIYCGRDLRAAMVQQGDKSKNEKRIHPTQKPVILYKWLLTNYAKPGDKILDTHMGSQSSRIASWDMGFDYIGCELDKEYYRDGEARFKAHTAKPVLFAPEEMYNFKQTELFE